MGISDRRNDYRMGLIIYVFLIDPKSRLGRRGRRILPRHGTGRWVLLQHSNRSEPTIEMLCWMLLNRYGIVFRDLLVREKMIPRWRELLIAFRRLEDRGEVRGGRFVSGFLGEQFALPQALDSLRIARKKEPRKEKVTLSAVDPLNLTGIILPGKAYRPLWPSMGPARGAMTVRVQHSG